MKVFRVSLMEAPWFAERFEAAAAVHAHPGSGLEALDVPRDMAGLVRWLNQHCGAQRAQPVGVTHFAGNVEDHADDANWQRDNVRGGGS